MTFDGWQRAILSGLGVATSKERSRFLSGWAACEGGTARFNPLNTTLRLAGSERFNSAGVQSYQDELQGVAATLLTLRLVYYGKLRHALRTPGIGADDILRASAQDIAKWGTNPDCIKRWLRSHH